MSLAGAGGVLHHESAVAHHPCLVAGGIPSLYASVAVWALVSRAVFVWYVSLAVVGSALGGWAYGLAIA